MGIRASSNKTTTGLVDQQIGTAYDDVKVVADNLSIVQMAADLSLTIEATATAIAADQVQVAADLVQTDLDTIATAADRVQTGLDAAATAADLVQTNLDTIATAADAVATAADRVQTGLDVTAASGSASAASTSAGQAASSASAASGSASAASSSASAASSSASAASGSASAASSSASAAATEVTYAAEWADKAEDTLISVAAGGNGTTDYSALHHANKASASASSASGSASTATTQAGNASASASSASTSASTATTKANEASASASSASTSASTATTKAGEASTSASNAATSESNASTSASSASTSASTATTQAGIATTQAGNASTSASQASTSASNASTSEGNASASAAAALVSENNAAASEANALTYLGLLQNEKHPSLVLDFATGNGKDEKPCATRYQSNGIQKLDGFDNIVTFTRASSGSYWGSDGLLKVNGASTDAPRFDHDPVTLAQKGLLIEEARTNRFVKTSNFTGPDWTIGGYHLVANRGIAPDGTYTATKFVAAAGLGTPLIYQNTNVDSATAYTQSVFAKQGEFRYLQITGSTGFPLDYANFDLQTGTITLDSSSIAKIEAVGNGWYRCTVTLTASSTGTGRILFAIVPTGTSGRLAGVTGNADNGLFIWGSQMELGVFPTSYIPSTDTFTSRSGVATYYDSNGRLSYAANNVERAANYYPGDLTMLPSPLYEGAVTNHLTSSELFSGWTPTGLSYTEEYHSEVPDGTVSSVLFVESSASSAHDVNFTFTPTASQPYTLSVYAKEHTVGSKRYLVLVLPNNWFSDAAYRTATFDVGSGTLTSVSSNGDERALVASVGNGWYRCSLSTSAVDTAALGSARVRLHNSSTGALSNYTGDGSSGLVFWGAQLETSNYPTSYVPSVETFTSRASTGTYYDASGIIQSAAINVERLTYNPSDLTAPSSQLFEEARTNSLLQSEVFDDASWTKLNASVSPNAATAPDGTVTADKLVENSTTSEHHTLQAVTGDPTVPNTFSVFVKAAGRTFVQLRLDSVTANHVRAVFDLTSGTVDFKANNGNGTGVAAGIVALPNSWYRVWVSGTPDTSGTSVRGLAYTHNGTGTNYLGDGSSGLYVWGAQLEAGSYLTSYIPTTTVAVTRAADVYSSAAGTRNADVYSSVAATRARDDAAVLTATPWLDPQKGTIICDAGTFAGPDVDQSFYALTSPTGNSNFISPISNVSSGERITASCNTNGVSQITSGIYGPIGSYVQDGTFTKVGMAYGVNKFALVHGNEGVYREDLTVDVPIGLDRIYIGAYYALGNRLLNGHIKSLKYYPYIMTQAELEAITA